MPRIRRRPRLRLEDAVCALLCFLATGGFAVEEFLGEEGAVEGCVVGSCAFPEQVSVPSKQKTAMARMASLLHKVVIKTSLVCVEVISAPASELATANGERLPNSEEIGCRGGLRSPVPCLQTPWRS